MPNTPNLHNHIPVYGDLSPPSNWYLAELITTDHHTLSHHSLLGFKHQLKRRLNHYITQIEHLDLLNLSQSNRYSIFELQILLQLCEESKGNSYDPTRS